ncbi:MAG: type VI secretion system baseplate subunit TssG [Legionellales bacterium]|nr:type VI secretion system baseplate subunit TssG [Legionellales bacterium]
MKTDEDLQFIQENIMSFDFFQLVKLLNQRDITPVKFVTSPSLSYAINEVIDLKIKKNQVDVMVTFMGLIGQSGILPEHLSSLVMERINAKDYTLYAFLNIFHHRLISLFYQAWEKARFYIGLEHQKKSEIIELVLSLTGISLIYKNAQEKNRHLFYAALFSNQNRTAYGLSILLSDYFSLPIKIMQLQGHWFVIEKDNLTKITVNSHNNTLGMNAIIGSKAWYSQNGFAVIIGDIDYEKFLDLLPSKHMMREIKKVIFDYMGYQFCFKLIFKINKKTIPIKKLTNEKNMQLGWTSWLNIIDNEKTQTCIEFGNAIF